MTPGTYKKPLVIREIEALIVKPGEVLMLRFSEKVSIGEVQMIQRSLQQGPLKGRVECLVAPEGEAVPTIFQGKT